MRNLSSRRGFFALTSNLLFPFVPHPSQADEVPTQCVPEGVDYYDKLGVSKIINAAGTYTAVTASTMPPSVQSAVAKAAKHPVRLSELQEKAGEYIARKLRCEAALVSSGASAALTLGMAACMTLGNRSSAQLLPLAVSKLKNEVIVQKAHRYEFDHAFGNCGAKFVEVESLYEYEAAFNERTAMCHYYNAADGGLIAKEKWIEIAHRYRVPCFNDAAADIPPISNLWKLTDMGFDLVTFSGGKGIRGPQNAGLLLGRADLIEAASWSNSPNHECVGRGFKVAKEQIVGMVAAVDWALAQTDEARLSEYHHRAERIEDYLKNISNLSLTIFVPPTASAVPHLFLRYDQKRVQMTPLEVSEILRRGSPSIEVNPATGQKSFRPGWPDARQAIVIGVWMLEPGEDIEVARRLRELFS